MDWQSIWETISERAQTIALDYGPNIIAAVIIFIVGRWVAKILRGVVRRLMQRANVEKTLTGFAVNIVYMLLMAFVIIAALSKAGVNTSSFVAIIGAAGLAIGFALQGSLANFAAGVMLIMFRPFKVGDFIEGGGATGVVEEIQVFCTMIKTGDNKTIIVPNSALTSSNITNYSAKPTRRVDMVFGIGYDDDIRAAKKILEDIMKADARVKNDPAPVIAVSELADSSVNIVCRPWVDAADYWGVYFDTHEAVKAEFDRHGISIPFPQRDVHLHQASSDAGTGKSAAA